MARAKPKLLACRFCGTTVERQDASHWVHSHPARCPYRQDRVPALNGVHVGDLWRNLHTRRVVRVTELRLGGDETYVDREPVAVTVDVWSRPDEETLDALVEPTLEELSVLEPDPDRWVHATPLWSLSEHWEPLTRPGEYPVPWEDKTDDRGYTSRWAVDAYRCPGVRGSDWSEERDKQYWHAWHYSDGPHTSGGWEWWLVDPDAVPTLVAPAEPKLGAAKVIAPTAYVQKVGFQMESYNSPDIKYDAPKHAWEPMQNGKASAHWKPKKTAVAAITHCCEWTGWLFIPSMQVRDLDTGEVIWRRTDREDSTAGPDIPHPDEPAPPWKRKAEQAEVEPDPVFEQAALF